jgi:membrane associated rhomboid family serine protease
MSAIASVPGAGGLFSGFTRLSKGLAAVLVTGCLANALFPHTISDTFSLVPGKFIPYVWNIVTAGYLETSVFGLGASIAALLLAGRHLEPFWGSREFLKFIIFVNLFTCLSTFVLAVFLYVITRQGGYLYAHISGFHGILAGFLVAVKQINPEQEVPFLKLRAKWSPSLFVAIALLSSLFSSSPIQFVPFIVFGTYGAWMYLRYFQRKPEAGLKGDSSAEFAFASFFPGPLQSFINPISTVLEKLCCGQRSQLTPNDVSSVAPGKPLPGSDSVEASRRRERGARALEERLGSFSGVAEGLPVSKGPSKEDHESKGADDLV